MDWLKRHFAIGAAVILHSTLAIGVAAVVVGVAIAAMWLQHSGWLAKAVPPLPTIPPVKIRVNGPTMIVRGGQYMFVADVSGPAGNPEWAMLPLGAGSLHVSADGRSAEFSTLDATSLALIVSVAGDGKQIAHDHIQVEVLDIHVPEPPPQIIQPQIIQQLMPQAAMGPPAPPSIHEMTLGALETVTSDDLPAEARTVAGSIRSVIARLNTGLMPPGSDVVEEIGKQIDAAMPERARKWATFVASLDTILDAETASGHVTAASKGPALAQIADVLQSQ
jgi:hypothetical protein